MAETTSAPPAASQTNRRQERRQERRRERRRERRNAEAVPSDAPDFNKEIAYYLDDERRNVYDDPTLQPWIDALQRESLESYNQSTYNLHDQMAQNGSLLGTGYYAGMMGQANEEFNEAMQGTMAGVYKDRFAQVDANELNALNMLNARNMADEQNKTAIRTAQISIRPGMASAGLARAQWNSSRPFTEMERTIGIMQGLNELGGYTTSPRYTQGAPGYYGPSSGTAGLMGGLAGGMSGAGMASNMGLPMYFGQQRGPG